MSVPKRRATASKFKAQAKKRMGATFDSRGPRRKPASQTTQGTNRGRPGAGGQTVNVGGQTVQVPGARGSAGVLNPTIKPFLTANDMMQQTDEQFDLETGLYDLDTALNKLRIDTDYNKNLITKSEGQAKSATVDNMIARGLFRSSVKDGEIYDIQATASMRRNFLDTALKTAEIETGNRKSLLNSRATAIKTAMERKAVENAQAANLDAPNYLQEPTPGTPATRKPAVGKPKSGFQFVQRSGSRAGKSYNLRPGPDGKLWRFYEGESKPIPRG